MKYAVEELRKTGVNLRRCKLFINESRIYAKVAMSLLNKEPIEAPDYVIEDLQGFLNSVENGLKSWGDDHLSQRKRQEKKQEELKEAIEFLT